MFATATIIAALIGFISLSYEILWFRVFSYVVQDSPKAFGLLLGFYLGGLAFGAYGAGIACREQRERAAAPKLWTLAGVIFLANIAGFLVVPIIAWITTTTENAYFALLPVAASAWLFGAILPLVSHIGIPPDARAGKALSYVYMANIVGASSGSLLTGFVLSDVWTTRQIALALAILGLLVTGIALWSLRLPVRRALSYSMCLAAAAMAFTAATPHLFDRLYERLQFKTEYRGQRFAEIIENRHGVIAVSSDSITYGGGAYDGRISTSLTDDRNMIVRAYAVTAMHPHPREVLTIGLSTGAWAQVLANAPGVEHLTAVEINPGYLQLIRRYPQVASILTNPKVNIVVDDGRRWLVHHPEKKFDLIVANISFHYRAHSTNLISREYMELVRAHLNPGGIYHFNTTWSQDAMETAFSEFPYGMRVINFAAVSDSPFHLDENHWRQMLSEFRIDGNPVFDLSKESDRARLNDLAGFATSVNRAPESPGLETRESVLSRIPRARVVTDDNMLTEWRTLLYAPEEINRTR